MTQHARTKKKKKTAVAGEWEGHETPQECPQVGTVGWWRRGYYPIYRCILYDEASATQQHQRKVTQRGHMIRFPLWGS